jgi:chromosome segregation ATPase
VLQDAEIHELKVQLVKAEEVQHREHERLTAEFQERSKERERSKQETERLSADLATERKQKADLERMQKHSEERASQLQADLSAERSNLAQREAAMEQRQRRSEEQASQRQTRLQMELASVKSASEAAVLDLQTQLMNSLAHAQTLAEHLDEFERKAAQWGAEKTALEAVQTRLETQVRAQIRSEGATQ